MTLASAVEEAVAIVGMACEFAGDIHSPTDFWRVLEQSEDVGTAIPPERTDLTSFCAHMLNQDKNDQFHKQLIRAGYFLSESHWDTFEPGFFGLSNSEAIAIDPAHRLLMLKFVHLVDDAGYTMEMMNGSRTSVHIGQFSTDHAYTTYRMQPECRTRLHGINSMLYNAAARLSYHFNLHGPNVSLDVACSSSLEAVHLAVQALRTGESDMAVCGGVNAVYAPENLLNGSLIGAVSPDGRSRSFSVDANGYAKGEGLGLVLLKRLSDAERDGDRIYCVLHDVLSHHDGNEDKNNFVVPSSVGQKRLLAAIYGRAKIDPQRIYYVEAHGTGTPVGDPIEANAIGQFFHRSSLDPPLLIGSVKSNIGHTEGASGIASLIKIAMCMRHRMLPPNMHFTSLNPKIDAQRYNLHVVQHFVPFPPATDGTVLIGINSFGMGGNTTHAIVEEYRPAHGKMMVDEFTTGPVVDENSATKQHFVFLFSTKCQESLFKQVDQFRLWLQGVSSQIHGNQDSFLMHISEQLLLKRTISYNHLAVFVCADRTQLEQQIDAFLARQKVPGLFLTTRPTSPPRKLCFVYSGQGPQWWAMGRQLYKNEPIFAQWIRRIHSELAKINQDGWSLLEELIEKSSEHESRINDTNIAQPALFAIQVSLTALLASWHIFPDTIVSHSAGEQAAAFVSGRVTLQEAIRVVYHRSRLQNRNTRQGGRMLAVSMSEQTARSELLKGIEHQVCVAVVNSSRSVTLSGDETIISQVQEILSTLHPNVFKALLRIENAFHSHQMDRFNIEEEMLSLLGDIRGLPLRDAQQMFDVRCSRARLYSSVSGDYVSDCTALDAHHWWSNVRQCVRFADAIGAVIRDNAADAFLELSPHPVLTTSIHECCELVGLQPLVLPTLKRKEDEQTTLLTSIVQLTTSRMVWQHYFKSRHVRSSDVDHALFESFPFYAFHTSPCWYESRESVIDRLSYRLPIHPLLGVRQWTQHTSATWKSLININRREYAFLKDHKIRDVILFPASAFLELALAGCRQLLTSDNTTQATIVFERVEFVNALVLIEHQLTEVFTQIVMPMREWFIYSRPWTSAGQSCVRTCGMSGVDVLNSFTDPHTLNQYSLSEFTLHAHGWINVDKSSIQQQAPLLIDAVVARDSYAELDPANIYAHLSLRGYQYGPSFRLVQSLRATRSIVEAQLDSSIFTQENLPSYHLIHPAVIDACLHPILAIIPGTSTTLLPVAIEKVTIAGETITVSSTVQLRGACHARIGGLGKEQTYECDCTITSGDTASHRPLVTFERFTIQQIEGAHSAWSTSDKSVFDKLNIIASLPNRDFTTHLNTIMAEHCLQKKWSEQLIVRSMADILPSPNEFTMKSMHSTDDEDLTESIQAFNELAACYARMALQELPLDSISAQKQPLLAACLSLTLHSKVDTTFHSTQLYLTQLLKRFPRLKPMLTVLAGCGLCLRQVLTGEQDGLEVLLKDEQIRRSLQEIQSLISASQLSAIFQVLDEHLRRTSANLLAGYKLRIFWLGGNSAVDVLPILRLLLDLSQETGLSIDLHYVDLDSVRLKEIEQTLSGHLSHESRLHMTFDNTFDLFNRDQNKTWMFESYDIVFTANKMQGCDHRASLANVRTLLVPNGLLLLLELTHAPCYFDLIFGLFEQWWSPADNQRALLDTQQWTKAIQQIGGFETVQVVPTTFGNSFIVAQKSLCLKILQTLEERQRQAWILFVAESNCNISDTLSSLLPSSNVTLIHPYDSDEEQIRSKIEQVMLLYEQVHIVFAWPLDQISVIENSERAFAQQEIRLCGTLVRVLQTIQTMQPRSFPFVFVLTRNAQPGAGDGLNPIGAALIGLVRSLTSEYERHRLKLIDLQSPLRPAELPPALLRALAEHLIMSLSADHLDEIILRQDEHAGDVKQIEWHYEMLQEQQYASNELKPEQISIVPHRDADQQRFRLQIASSRSLEHLMWIREKSTGELLTDELEVRVHCVGIDFRDVLKVRGLYPHVRPFSQSDKERLLFDRDTEGGFDFVGTVIRSGSSGKFEAGDRVLGVSSRGVLRSHVIVDNHEVVRIPEECNYLTDEQLAAMPYASLMALYSLKHRINLQCDQTVLIHAATGAAGQFCIQYCRAIGARVLVTDDSDEKCRFLRECCDIEHVFNSEDFSFVNGIRSLLPDGVDVIINSLSGSLLQASIKLLSFQGHFVQWGKKDVFDKSHVSMFDLRNDCTFHLIDINTLFVHRPNEFHTLINEVMELIRRGDFKPIEPTTIYEASQVIEAFGQFNNGEVIGKCVLRLVNSRKLLILNDQQTGMPNEVGGDSRMFPLDICERSTILISGGFGGLGLTMSRWMIEEHGVKRLVLMSRRTMGQLDQVDNPEYEEWQRLQRMVHKHGAHVEVVQADVTKFEDVHGLIERLNKTPYPVRGIIHSAVVQEDRSLAKITQANFTRVFGPKIRGAWNLHRASQLASVPLHFFLLFSSIRNHLIDLATSGYNAGNQFLDILAHYRVEQLNLPALSISLPGVSGAGMFHRHRHMLTHLQHATGFDLVPTTAVFELIERFHANQKTCPCPIVFAVNWQKLYENRHGIGIHQVRRLVAQRHASTSGSSATLAISSDSTVASESIYDRLESIVERTRTIVASLLGTTNVEQIDVNRSLVSQGMDSLAAASLYNWLGQETGIFISLAEILKGISIQSIAEHVHRKRQAGKQANAVSTDSESKLHADLAEQDEIERYGWVPYTGTENVLCIRRPFCSDDPVLFCISTDCTEHSHISSHILVKKTLEQFGHMSAAAFYILQIASMVDIGASSRDIISQIRRVQPRGPYTLVATHADHGEIVADALLKQLQNYSSTSIIQLLLLK
ncbi:unnamed protein product [Adineta ricciae]|uniref:Polyketide synthase n=1 Tax=Adineta ricciae TaxID=249248 RepID=A0A814LP06_ADIRI|nr:unnamed protein product [Adineta ricciae]